MDINLNAFLIVCPLVFLGGLVDSIAGGGGLITLPAYIFAGAPMHFALGTNKLSSTLGQVTASYRYYRNRCVDLPLCIPSAAAALGGSALGSSLTLLVNPVYLQGLLVLVLPLTAFWTLRSRGFRDNPAPLSRRRTFAYTALISLGAGCYDGFFGPGTGTFLILLYTGLARLDPRTASGNAKIANLASNAGALAVFVRSGNVLFPLGLAAGCFSVLGSYLGAGLAIRRGSRIIRLFIIAVIALLFVKTIWDLLQGMSFAEVKHGAMASENIRDIVCTQRPIPSLHRPGPSRAPPLSPPSLLLYHYPIFNQGGFT